MNGGAAAGERPPAQKLADLREILRPLDQAVVAFSGGVDSTFLLRIAADTLRDRVTALTAVSPSLPETDRRRARHLARKIGVDQVIVESREMDDPGYTANDAKRCYFCKSELYRLCADQALRLGVPAILDGTNVDDLADHRPGRRAARERGVRSPLVEAGFTKADIRALSRELGLETWDQPSSPCLSSRIAYGTPVTREALARVERCERFLRDMGFRDLRVRHHDTLARVEVGPGEIDRLLDPGLRARIIDHFKEAGYVYVTLDLEGFRSGSGNEVLADPSSR
ncbi:MAG: ATP-dependent sacrificial sulfur transferase LarE [Myxococcota bacterium]